MSQCKILIATYQVIIPELIVEYFVLVFIKKKLEILHLYLKCSIPKEYRQSKLSSKGFFDEITVQDFPIKDIRYTFTLLRRWPMKTLDKSFFRYWNLVANAAH
jgi:hypothetical protein